MSQEKWLYSHRQKLITVDGFIFLECYNDLKHDIEQFEVYDDDVWLCGYAKSGTTWTQEMVWLIANKLDFEGAKVYIEDRFPQLEKSLTTDMDEIIEKVPEFKALNIHQNSISKAKDSKRPRLIKTHLPLHLCPKQLRDGSKKPKIIYVTRDPRDVCVSYYHHRKNLKGTNDTFDEFCDLFIDGKVVHGPFWNHVLPFWEMQNKPNVLVIKYEDMKTDLRGVIIKTANFLNCALKNEEIDRLINHLSFDSMKKNPAANREKYADLLRQYNKVNKGESLMRKGIVGDYKNSMSSETLGKFENWIKKNTEGTGYTI